MEEELDDYLLMRIGSEGRQGECLGSYKYVAEAIKAATHIKRWYILDKHTIKTIVTYEDKL